MTDEFSDELPDEFARLIPQSAPAELRPRVLAAVTEELAAPSTNVTAASQRRKPRWERSLELATAASLVLGIGLHVWQSQRDAAWREQVFGRPSEANAIAAERPADPTARAIAGATGAAPDARTPWEQYHQLLRELVASTATSKL
jgi:hypothetical protein